MIRAEIDDAGTTSYQTYSLVSSIKVCLTGKLDDITCGLREVEMSQAIGGGKGSPYVI